MALVLVLPLVLGLSTGCARVHDQLSGATVDAAVPAPPGTDLLQVIDWSVTGGLVSVVVRNVQPRTLETADVTLVGVAADGTEVGAWTGSTPLTADGCCQLAGLAPGDLFGLSFAVGTQASRIAAIRLDYRDLGWSDAPARPSPVTATLRAGGLSAGNTLVLARLRNTGRLAPAVLLQAVLRGRSGRLYAVATDRWSCLPAGAVRDVQLSLFQPVPAGVRVTSLVARPVHDGAQPDCSPTPA